MSWVLPDGCIDVEGKWQTIVDSYNGSTLDGAVWSFFDGMPTSVLEWTLDNAILCDKVRFYIDNSTMYNDLSATLWVYYDGGWHEIWSGILEEHLYGWWYEYPIPDGPFEVSAARLQFDGITAQWLYKVNFDFNALPSHRVYRGQDGNMDYENCVAVMDLDDSQVSILEQELPPDTIWHFIRRQVSECGLESEDSPACAVAIDSAGDMVGNVPNPPLDLIIQGLSEGRFKLRWRYTPIAEEVPPTGFKVYMDSGEGFDFNAPIATVPYNLGGFGEFAWTSDPLTNGQLYRFCVRSYQTGPPITESQNTNFVAAVADSVGPDAITGLRTSWKEI